MPVSRGAGSLTRLTQAAPPIYICSQCRFQASRRRLQTRALSSTSSHAQKPGLTNRLTQSLRKRIWGTDTPPGPKDPYRKEGKASQIVTEPREPSRAPDRVLARGQEDAREPVEEDQGQAQAKGADEQVNVDTSNYVPAANWDGLIAIGGPTGWWEEAFDQQNQFEGY